MRFAIVLSLVATMVCSLGEDLFRENESIDSVMEKKAYFAFKLKDDKLERRVMLVQELSKQLQKASQVKNLPDLTTQFVPISALELRIARFYYDEKEHGDRMNSTIAEVARALCASYPRHLTFDKFTIDGMMIRGHMQNSNMGESAMANVLIENGFTYRGSDVKGGGFVVVKNNAQYKALVQQTVPRGHYASQRGPPQEVWKIHPAATIFLQKPLRTSVYVDTLSVCKETSAGTCEEIAFIKIDESCKKAKIEL